MRERNPELHKQKVSMSLFGNHRRWLGDDASYFAKHMWIIKYWGNADHCDFCLCHRIDCSHFEWANKYHGESRNREDFFQLCPSCHRLYDQQDKCRKGHPYTPETTSINSRGHRRCLICKSAKETVNATTT